MAPPAGEGEQHTRNGKDADVAVDRQPAADSGRADAMTAAAPLERARAIAVHFASQARVLGVAVFGSVARGSASPSSDIDLLVLVAKDGPSRLQLVSGLPSHLRGSRLTVLCYRPQDLSHLMEHETSFTAHLRKEARILVDPAGDLEALLTTSPRDRVPVQDELKAELSQLDAYQNLDVFRGNYLFVLGRLYALGKAIVMLGLYADGDATFDRNEAFAEFCRRHPETASSIDIVRRLLPFYMYVMRRVEKPFPFPYRDSTEQVVQSISAIRNLAAAVR